jgi:hypothetical protein
MRYVVVPDRSTVSISGRSTLHPIRATADGLNGWLDAEVGPAGFEPGYAVTGHIELAVHRLASGNALIDRETRRRIDARRHPLVTGDVTDVLAIDGATATVEGVIGFHGEDIAVEGDLEISTSAPGVALRGEARFDVRWWGLEPPRLMALRVHPDIVVSIHVFLVPE